MRLDLHSLLFGDILAVSREDIAVIWGGGALALGVLWRLWRPLLAATVDADLASVAGLRPERARLLFGLLVAVIIAIAIKIVGILLIVALLVIPAAAVRRFAPSPEWMAAGAALAGVVSAVGGLYASATWDTPSGPSIRRGNAGALHRDPPSPPAGDAPQPLSPSARRRPGPLSRRRRCRRRSPPARSAP